MEVKRIMETRTRFVIELEYYEVSDLAEALDHFINAKAGEKEPAQSDGEEMDRMYRTQYLTDMCAELEKWAANSYRGSDIVDENPVDIKPKKGAAKVEGRMIV